MEIVVIRDPRSEHSNTGLIKHIVEDCARLKITQVVDFSFGAKIPMAQRYFLRLFGYSNNMSLKKFIQAKINPGAEFWIAEGGCLHTPSQDSYIFTKNHSYYDHDFCDSDDMRSTPIIDKALVNHILQNNPTKFKQPKDEPREILEIQKQKNGRQVHLIIGQNLSDQAFNYSRGFYTFSSIANNIVNFVDSNPFVVFKRHPLFDVPHCGRVNFIARSLSIKTALRLADHVHVVSSGAGVEALIAGKTVHTYGTSIYSHRGLTIDHMDMDMERKKKRKCTIEQFVNFFFLKMHKFAGPIETLIKQHEPKEVKIAYHYLGL